VDKFDACHIEPAFLTGSVGAAKSNPYPKMRKEGREGNCYIYSLQKEGKKKIKKTGKFNTIYKTGKKNSISIIYDV
jgi:hypothetical protein